MPDNPTDYLVGIDVGGPRKGFHMVAVTSSAVIAHFDHAASVESVMAKLHDWGGPGRIPVVAVDAPCGWSRDRGSRQAERDLKLNGRKISCFCTPTAQRADDHLSRATLKGRADFYGWVRNGMALFEALGQDWPLYSGEHRQPVTIETFPQAVSCFLQGAVVKRDMANRLGVVSGLVDGAALLRGDVDFIDAALCALAARAFNSGEGAAGANCAHFGNAEEGFIVLPRGSGRKDSICQAG